MTWLWRRSIKSYVVSLCFNRYGDQMVVRGLTLLLIMLSLATSAAFGDVLIGRHKNRGTTPDGSSYSGKVDISIQGGVYFIRWYLTTGEIYDGRGKLEGDTLTIDWGDTTPVIYKVEPNGVLRGTWGGGKGTDTITPEKETIALNKIGEGCDSATKDADKAIKECSELLDMWHGPTGQTSDAIVPTFFLIRGQAWRKKGEIDRALADIQKALELSPNYSDAYYRRGQIAVDRGDLDAALPDLNKAIELETAYLASEKDPEERAKYSDYFYARGWVLEQKSEKERARADYQKTLELYPGYTEATEGLARLASDGRTDCITMGIGDEKNIKACTQFIAANPKHPDLAKAYAKRGWAYQWGLHNPSPNPNLDLALADFSRAIELEPGDDDHYLKRGQAYQAKGNFDLAANDFRKALAIRPTHALAKTLLEQVLSDQPQDCQEEAAVSITGTITSVQKSESGSYLKVKQNKPGCKIYGIIDSNIPAECVAGASISASGYVEEADLIDLEELSCK